MGYDDHRTDDDPTDFPDYDKPGPDPHHVLAWALLALGLAFALFAPDAVILGPWR